MQKITTCLWLENNAEEAVDFYVDIFPDSSIIGSSRYSQSGARATGKDLNSVMTILFKIAGQEFCVVNGGPMFKMNPSVSLVVECETEEQIDRLHNYLVKGGSELMPLAKYPFSEKFGWLNDRWGVSWQLILARKPLSIAPCLMFVNGVHGRAAEAMQFYTEQFADSKVDQIVPYTAEDQDKEGTVKRGFFHVAGQKFLAMDSGHPHQFDFNCGMSFIVNCLRQSEVDSLWEKLSEDGVKNHCGWLQDKFGLSWQIVPTTFTERMLQADTDQMERMTVELYKMHKLDANILEDAFAKVPTT